MFEYKSGIEATEYRCERLESIGLWISKGGYSIDGNMLLCFPNEETYKKAMEVLKR